MAMTDTLNLNKSQMFEKIRKGLTAETAKTQNLLECKDEMLFAWDVCDSCLLVIDWRAAKLKGLNEIRHQTLIPSTPQNFNVERVLSSTEGSLIALAGPRGLAVLELPPRWGPNGQFMEGKDTITCRSNNVDEHFFVNNPQIEIRQMRWHPASPTDSHIFVLLSDNTIRVYDNFTLRHVWQVGPLCTNIHSDEGCATLPSPYVLGESVVDFDIGPAITLNNFTQHSDAIVDNLCDRNAELLTNNNFDRTNCNGKIKWPIVVLHENGNIYVLPAGIDTEKPRLEGPLTIRPQKDDNYGLDSCAILIIPSLPPTVVIAESTGKLHHALFLENDVLEKSLNEVDLNLDINPSKWTIDVLETVELELGMPNTRNTPTSYTCSIYLKRDPVNELRYFAYHNTGLHAITINFIKEIDRYLSSDVISDLSTLSNKSQAEYLVCTKINESNKVNSVYGFVFMQMPSTIVLLLSSGQAVSLDLVLDINLFTFCTTAVDLCDKRKLNCISNKKSVESFSFSEHIQNLLKRSVTQPIIMLNKSAHLTPQESYELLMQSMEVLRTHYMKKHDQVRGEFLQRLNIIKLRKQQQKDDIERLEKERDLIRERAHHQAERFEEISENQELLLNKCQNLVRQTNSCLPYNSQAEKEFALQVIKINNVAKTLANAPQKAKENISRQCYHIQKYIDENPNKLVSLPEKQENTIKEILLQMVEEIDGQIKEVKRINNILQL